jgi:tRNA (mo5U34)-methyltransferase
MKKPAFSLSDKEILARISKVKTWYQPITLGDVITPSISPSKYFEWRSKALPDNLEGKTVLDVGANEGYFSFLCESRGANRILAIDDPSYVRYGHQRSVTYDPREGFEIAKGILNSKVEYRTLSVFDLDCLDESFDLVLYLDVYYHLEEPLLALRKLYNKTKWMLIFSGLFIEDERPMMYLYEPYEKDPNDPTNVWSASISCLMRMFKRVGFRDIQLYGTYDQRALIHAYR